MDREVIIKAGLKIEKLEIDFARTAQMHVKFSLHPGRYHVENPTMFFTNFTLDPDIWLSLRDQLVKKGIEFINGDTNFKPRIEEV